MTLSIIIVTYNVKYFLEQCLYSVTEAIKDVDAEVIVIDNGSDDSITYLQPRFSWIKFITNQDNEGFAKANNKALQTASGEYILFLNPDTILGEDTLEECIFFYKKKPLAGAIGVQMIDGSGTFLPESKRSFPSPLVSFYKLTGLSALFSSSRVFGKYALGYLPPHEVHEADVIAGAFMMVPKKILDKTGGFDEQFFMYAEDIDLSYRIQKAGYKNYYLGNLIIVHFKGESTKKGSFNYVKVFYGAMNLFVKKWYHGAGSWLLRQALQTGIIVRKSVSAVSLPFHKNKIRTQQEFNQLILLGDTERTSLAEKMVLNYYNKKKTLMLNDVKEITGMDRNAMIVFCMGQLSYKKSIEILQEKKFASYKWFGKDSTSIVGSDHKNSTGDVLTG